MTFSEITTNLLAKKNCSLYKNVEGVFFVQDLHKYVKDTIKIVNPLRNAIMSNNFPCKMGNPWYRTYYRNDKYIEFTEDECNFITKKHKEQLLYILENFDNMEKHSLNWKPKKRKR